MYNIHPYGILANWMWKRYRDAQGAVFDPPTTVVTSSPATSRFTDSSLMSVISPIGSGIQAVNLEPMGEPYISLHQNNYYNPPGASLGTVNFCSRDDIGVSLRANMDGEWTNTDKPSSFSIFLTRSGFATPSYQALGITSSGAVSVGNSKNLSSNLVSFGVYRNGVIQLPKVSTMADLGRIPPSNGLITYVEDIDQVMVSVGGTWKKMQLS